jgi:hypothetical protein
MAVSQKRASERAEEVLSRPRSRMEVIIRHGKGGVTVLYQGQVIARTWDSIPGRAAASLVAEALGARLPPVGRSVAVTVSSGVLFRAISISTLDPRTPEGRLLALNLLEEAAHLRGLGESVVLE